MLMHTHSAHAATDISGLGLLGHAAALARLDLSSLSLKYFKYLSAGVREMKSASLFTTFLSYRRCPQSRRLSGACLD